MSAWFYFASEYHQSTVAFCLNCYVASAFNAMHLKPGPVCLFLHVTCRTGVAQALLVDTCWGSAVPMMESILVRQILAGRLQAISAMATPFG